MTEMTEMIDVTEAIGVEVVFVMAKFTKAWHDDLLTVYNFLEGTMSLLLGLVNYWDWCLCVSYTHL